LKDLARVTEILVVGAGPVGMLAALCAVRSGFSVTIFEKNNMRPKTSRAIGITPPSLEILSLFRLDRAIIAAGVPVRYAEVYSAKRLLGTVDFKNLKTQYPFVCSIPQDRTEQILEDAVRQEKKICILLGHEVVSCSHNDSEVTVEVLNDDKKCMFTGKYLIACDGTKSAVRSSLNIRYAGAPYKETFLMGDFEDATGWASSARFFFTSHGSIESFPLPDGCRRYVLRTPYFIKEYSSDYLEREIPLRCGIDIGSVKKVWESGFGVQHFIAEKFSEGRVFLCGDAAHAMSPIGGQNMNLGFADAELAVWMISHFEGNKSTIEKINYEYTRIRKKAVLSAVRRSELMMKLGTSGGKIWSPIRNLMTFLLLHSPAQRILKPVFTMLSIPYRNIRHYSESLARKFQ
jgi:2-polyprenyl-6-methoxyphenol hydroxylase-like FAD-dependent oxidoreductase